MLVAKRAAHTANWIMAHNCQYVDYVRHRKLPADDSMKNSRTARPPTQYTHCWPAFYSADVNLNWWRCRYNFFSLHPQIALVTVTIISMSVAMPDRAKLKFRPPGEWFENMQEPAEQSPSYFEQSDQPAESQFRDLFIEDDEPVVETKFTGGSKFPRNHITSAPAVFQSLCPTKRSDVVLSTDSFYEYRPSSYEVVSCKRLFSSSCDRNLNF